MTTERRYDPRDADPLYFDEADEMCPNCVTPWKCNGPHLVPLRDIETREEAGAGRLLATILAIVALFVVVWAVGKLIEGAAPSEGPDTTLAGPSQALRGAPQLAVAQQKSGPGDDSAASLRATRTGTGGASIAIGTALVSGTATWCAPTPTHCQSWGGKARVGAMASFRWGDTPYWVSVCHEGRCTVVKVVSFCQCPRTLIDLSPYAFEALAPLSRGRINVTVETAFLPATDAVQ